MERIVKAMGYSVSGLQSVWQTEAAFRQEIVLCVIMVPLGLWLGENGVERALLIGVLLLLLIVELVNSAVEAAIDRIGPEIHPLSKAAKDIGSAAVALCFFNVAVVWFLILW